MSVKKNGNLLELLADKIALAVAGLVCLWVLFAFVLGTPNAVEYNNRKYGPGEIDKYIRESAIALEENLSKNPTDNLNYESRMPQFASAMEKSITGIDPSKHFPLPGYSQPVAVDEDRVYRLPSIPDLDSIAVAGIKMAAFVPKEELSSDLPYSDVATEIQDLFLVTVESRLDISQLHNSFKESFTGSSLKAGWREEKYAKPVFAATQLQRRQRLDDGSLGQWESIGRTKICHLESLLKIPEEASEYNLEISMHQFNKPLLRNEILQPGVYDNAIPAQAWLSPSFYNARQKELAEEQERLKREALEAERASRIRERGEAEARGRTPGTRGAPPTRGPMEAEEDSFGMGRPSIRTSRTSRERPQRTTRESRASTARRAASAPVTTDELSEEEKFEAAKLGEGLDFGEMQELVFWAHDDTARTGASYQYRIRIGVFNPIAGTNWFTQDQQQFNDQAVLWGNYSQPSDVIEIPKNLYFFPTDLRITTRSSAVEVKVARFTLGNWITKSFNIKSGEEIGRAVPVEELDLAEVLTETPEIDFSTGKVMVDVETVTQWKGAGVLRPREYSELIYAAPGGSLERMPIKQRYWPSSMVEIFEEIEESTEAPPVILLGRDQASRGISSSHSVSGSTSERFAPPPGGFEMEY